MFFLFRAKLLMEYFIQRLKNIPPQKEVSWLKETQGHKRVS